MYGDVLTSGLSLFGTSDTVVEKLVQLSDMGASRAMTLYNFGLMLQSVVFESMHALVEDALPRADITAFTA